MAVRRVTAPTPGLRAAEGALRATRRGFTLIELLVVVVLIGLMMSVALPSLLPLIQFANIEGSARHLGNYGVLVMDESALTGQQYTVKVDLGKQHYWAERWPKVRIPRLSDETLGVDDDTEPYKLDLAAMDPEKALDLEEAADQIRDDMLQFLYRNMTVRASRVKKSDEGLLSEIGPLFEDDLLQGDDEKKEKEEVKDPILARVKMPSDIQIESVKVGGELHSSGTIDIEVLPIGLGEQVFFYLKNDDNEYFTVKWDPILRGSRIADGKQTEL